MYNFRKVKKKKKNRQVEEGKPDPQQTLIEISNSRDEFMDI
jgi:hypothetical protein